MDRFYEIGRTLKNHHVSRLCHITQVDKLFSILYGDEGILATDFCDSKSMYRNDVDRMDGKQSIFQPPLSIQMSGITAIRRMLIHM